VSSIAISRGLEDRRPDLALTFFPLNADAQARVLTNAVNISITAGLPEVERAIRRAVRHDSGDARLYSLLGATQLRQGDREAGYRSFAHARALSKTEMLALKNEIGRSIEAGAFAEALVGFDILLRRWPNDIAAMQPVFTTILADPAGYRAAVDMLAAGAPWRRVLLGQLARDPAAVGIADRLIIDLRADGDPSRPEELATAIGQHIGAKRYEAAYRLFLLTRADSGSPTVGYVNNGGFRIPLPSLPFDWQLRPQPGVAVTFSGDETGGGDGAGATLRFMNRPLKLPPMQQYLLLPPGPYSLAVDTSGDGLRLPKGLSWAVKCLPSQKDQARLAIPDGSFDLRSIELSFTIPSQGCEAQLLRLEAAPGVQGWSDAYAGTLILHELAIRRRGA